MRERVEKVTVLGWNKSINALYLGNPKVRTIFIIQNLITNYNTTCLTTQIILFGGMHVLPVREFNKQLRNIFGGKTVYDTI